MTTRWRSRPVLLVSAAIAIISGDLCGEAAWGGAQRVALAFFALGMGLAMWTMARRPDGGAPASEISGLQRVVWIALAVHLAVGIVYCRVVPAHNIDTWTFQTEAARRLAHGVDPYGGTQANPYAAAESAKFYGPGAVRDGRVQVGLQYPPLTVLWILPGYWLGDIRLSYVAAVMLTAVLVFMTAQTAWGAAMSLFLLLNPFTWIVENRCWTEPLILMFVAATVFAAVRRRAWLPVAFGLLVAAKQYDLLALPLGVVLLAPSDRPRMVRHLGVAIAVACAVYAPFLAWNARGLFHDLVMFHLNQPFRPDALIFAVVWPGALKVGPVMLLAFLGWAMWTLRGAAMFAAAFGMAVMLFFVFGKQGFANYFFLVAGCWTVAAAALRPGSTQQVATNPMRGTLPSWQPERPWNHVERQEDRCCDAGL